MRHVNEQLTLIVLTSTTIGNPVDAETEPWEVA